MFYHYTLENFDKSEILLIELIYGKDTSDKDDKKLKHVLPENSESKKNAVINSS
jgi:hypothetical protein